MAIAKKLSTKKKKATHSKASKAAPKRKSNVRVAPSQATATASTRDLLTRLPAITARHRSAYFGQFADAACLALGAETKSKAVRDGAIAWSVEALPVLSNTHLANEVDYAPERLTWVVELVVQLDEARGKTGSKGTAQSSVRTTLDVAVEKGTEARKRLEAKLARAGASAPVGMGSIELAESLGTLASQIDGLIRNGDESSRIRIESARLSSRDVTNARELITAINAAKNEVVLLGHRHGDRDTPEVNVVEGRVLKELLLLRDAFDEARARGIAIPVLVPPKALQHVLARSHAVKTKKSAAPAGGTSAGGSTPTPVAST